MFELLDVLVLFVLLISFVGLVYCTVQYVYHPNEDSDASVTGGGPFSM